MEEYLSQEFKTFRTRVKALVQDTLDPIHHEVEKSEEIPEPVVDQFRELGFFGLSIPKEYGGLGLSCLEEILTYEEITRTNACYRSRIGTSNGIGSMGILYDGTPEQKQTYLPRIASGEWTAAFALTEPDAGSDAANISTTAVLAGDHWLLNGTKQFITNADTAQLFTTIAVTDEEKRARGGVTAFVVERGMPGLSIGARDAKMGLKGSHTHEVIFKNCRVPQINVIGGNAMVGQGFKTAMRVLDKGRLSMGACALGACGKILDICLERLRRLQSAGWKEAQLQSSWFALADMATELQAARAMLYQTARQKDAGANVTTQASMVKVFCTETASRSASRGLMILGRDGVLTRHQVETFLRDVRLYRIYEGTSEIQRKIIARNLLKQGVEHVC
ncbi:MAG: acyl-CoA dehydrogenase family protein [Desulfobacterales bacterium]|nr:acyl-CoA dehydrogenase family protein [Desulfobacterales bacterium]